MSHRKIKVLVINDEPDAIDRRITHQLEVLADAGFSVFFAKPMGKNDTETFVWNGAYTIVNYPSAYTSFSHNIFRILNFEQTAPKPGSRSLLYFLGMFLRGLFHAPLMASMLRNRLPKLKHVLGYWFEAFVFLFLLRFDLLYAMVKHKIFARRINKAKTRASLEMLGNFIKPDIVHGHDLPCMIGAVKIAEAFDAKLVMDAHEIYAGQFTFDKSRHKKQLSIEKYVMGKIDLLISVNSYCLDYLENQHGKVKQTAAISNAVLLPFDFEVQKGKLWHDKFDLPSETKLIVFQGGINPLRSIDELVMSLGQLPEHIHLGFITYAKDVSYYSALSKNLGVDHRIHYVLDIDWTEVLSWIKAADFGIIPYQVTSDNAFAASPNKMYEFATAGVPIIATSNLPRVKTFVEKYQIGITHPFSDASSYAQGIAAAMEWAETQPQLQENLNKAALANDYSENAEKLLEAYKRLLN